MIKTAQMQAYIPLREELVSGGWQTPDTYANFFEPLSNRSAVYLFLLFDRDVLDCGLVAYVGMSTKLKQRLSNHEIISLIDGDGRRVMRWFKPTPACDLRSVEAQYIAKFDPPWNIMGRPRGVILQ